MTTKALKKQLMAAIAMVVVAAIALTSSTYAWFVNNSEAKINAQDYTATTASYLLISDSGNANTFGTSISLAAPPSLTPVSTSNATIVGENKFFKVDENSPEAWKNNLASNFALATAGADYFMDDFWLESSVAGQNVKVTFTLNDTTTSGSAPIREAMYVAFTKVGDNDAETLVKAFQLDNKKTAGTMNNTNTKIGTEIDANGVYTIKGLKNSSGSGTFTIENGTTFSITSQAFDSITDAGESNAQHYKVYVWLEGTDPQCLNTIASNKVNIAMSFNAAE